jgi:hypothetical protein
MISGECFTSAWQTRKREELGGCDPVLLEKTIYAFALLDALATRGLEFVFKGGTSLLLRLPRIRRLSIDVDIFCHESPEKLNRLLAEVSRTPPFASMTEDDRGDHRIPARRHFKFFYTPLDAKNPAPFVLLDVVHERNIYPQMERVPLRTHFVEGDCALFVPTIEGLLGDKLTAFGPNTTGVALNEKYTMQFMKQVFDIDALLDAGRKQIESHLVGVKFRREEMKTAAAKAALLTSALRAGVSPAFAALRYDDTKLAGLKDVKFDAAYSAVGKLKPVPEAMWFWVQALRLRG